MRKLAILPLAFALSGCALFQTGQPVDQAQLQAELATAAAALKTASCGVAMLSSVAAPIVAVTADADGNKVLSAIGAGGAALCSIPAPASVSSAPGTTLGAVIAP